MRPSSSPPIALLALLIFSPSLLLLPLAHSNAIVPPHATTSPPIFVPPLSAPTTPPYNPPGPFNIINPPKCPHKLNISLDFSGADPLNRPYDPDLDPRSEPTATNPVPIPIPSLWCTQILSETHSDPFPLTRSQNWTLSYEPATFSAQMPGPKGPSGSVVDYSKPGAGGGWMAVKPVYANGSVAWQEQVALLVASDIVPAHGAAMHKTFDTRRFWDGEDGGVWARDKSFVGNPPLFVMAFWGGSDGNWGLELANLEVYDAELSIGIGWDLCIACEEASGG